MFFKKTVGEVVFFGHEVVSLEMIVQGKLVCHAIHAIHFGDSMAPNTSPGYGSMQIHNNKEKQSIICFNNFRARSNADVGIGNSGTPKAEDWTFTKNAKQCSVAELKVLIKK